jgi:hypothetical protein
MNWWQRLGCVLGLAGLLRVVRVVVDGFRQEPRTALLTVGFVAVLCLLRWTNTSDRNRRARERQRRRPADK